MTSSARRSAGDHPKASASSAVNPLPALFPSDFVSGDLESATGCLMASKDCPQCGGAGWRPVDRDGVRLVARCECEKAQHSDSLLKAAQIPRRYEHCAFENFDIRKDPRTGQPNRSLVAAKLYSQKLVEEYPTDFGLLFVGPTGVGKTHLGVAVLRELVVRKNVRCLYYDFLKLLKDIRDSYNPGFAYFGTARPGTGSGRGSFDA